MKKEYAKLDHRKAFATSSLTIRHNCSINAIYNSLDCILSKEVVYIGLRWVMENVIKDEFLKALLVVRASNSYRLFSTFTVNLDRTWFSVDRDIVMCEKLCWLCSYANFHVTPLHFEWIIQTQWFTTQFTNSGRDLSSLSNGVDDNWKLSGWIYQIGNGTWPPLNNINKNEVSDYKVDEGCKSALLGLDNVILIAAAVLLIYLNSKVWYCSAYWGWCLVWFPAASFGVRWVVEVTVITDHRTEGGDGNV